MLHYCCFSISQQKVLLHTLTALVRVICRYISYSMVVRCRFAATKEREEASAAVNGAECLSRRVNGHTNIQAVQYGP